MTVDREQVRRDDRERLRRVAESQPGRELSRDYLALLDELEQAERRAAFHEARERTSHATVHKLEDLLEQAEAIRAEYDRELEKRTAALEQAERELADKDSELSDLAVFCAEETGRLIDAREAQHEAEAQLAAVPALVEALREIYEARYVSPRGLDGKRAHEFAEWMSDRADDALAKWERAQEPTG